ncbi:hypothetical protein X777_07870 [Ooceraea biroi]|uniref:Uncharacterized protein n=1 Tax=Ooceraea biroi TaxID=2015173 RepID=A0A026WZS7_OOCBI|nr:hypothetical protein X777_07870 [Ooceraea biroi]
MITRRDDDDAFPCGTVADGCGSSVVPTAAHPAARDGACGFLTFFSPREIVSVFWTHWVCRCRENGGGRWCCTRAPRRGENSCPGWSRVEETACGLRNAGSIAHLHLRMSAGRRTVHGRANSANLLDSSGAATMDRRHGP